MSSAIKHYTPQVSQPLEYVEAAAAFEKCTREGLSVPWEVLSVISKSIEFKANPPKDTAFTAVVTPPVLRHTIPGSFCPPACGEAEKLCTLGIDCPGYYCVLGHPDRKGGFKAPPLA
jgi:hypothetical protein